MTVTGTTYGVILNDREQLAALAPVFAQAPYGASPVAPVLYINSRNCYSAAGGYVRIPATLGKVEIAATVGLLIGTGEGAGAIAGACLAIDVSERHDSFFRPAIQERCRDGFLPLGTMTAAPSALDDIEISTSINGSTAHRWSLQRLHRGVAALLRDIGEFMTLGAGDMLLVGLPGDAPSAGVGDRVEVSGGGLPSLRVHIESEERS